MLYQKLSVTFVKCICAHSPICPIMGIRLRPENSMIVGYKELVNKGGGATGFGEKANSDKSAGSENTELHREKIIKFLT